MYTLNALKASATERISKQVYTIHTPKLFILFRTEMVIISYLLNI